MTRSEKVQIVLNGIVPHFCPSDFGLKDVSKKRCKCGKKTPCKTCWKEALQGDKKTVHST